MFDGLMFGYDGKFVLIGGFIIHKYDNNVLQVYNKKGLLLYFFMIIIVLLAYIIGKYLNFTLFKYGFSEYWWYKEIFKYVGQISL